MPTNHCRHLKEDGAFCQMPALRERNYCFFHLRERGRRLRMAQEAARQRSSPLVLPPFEDMTAVNAGLTLVAVALAFRRIDQRTAGLLLYALQQAASNLKFMATMAASSEATKDEREFADEYPGFEAEFGLPPNFDVDTPPEVAFPPQPVEPEPSPYRSNPWQMINPEDVELEELLRTKGEEAYKKRQAQLSAKHWKQTEREKRVLNEARWIVEADRRNYAPVPTLTPEEQRAHDLKVIADFEAQYPKPKPAAETDAVRVEQANAGALATQAGAVRVERRFSAASRRSSLDGALAPEGRYRSAKKPPAAADEIEIKAEAALKGR
jgi:hypothetical protein